jgi:hypothetical protein
MSALKWLHEQRNKKTAPLFEKVLDTKYPDTEFAEMDGKVAFAVAIKEGILSTDQAAINWAGYYMFMFAERVWHEDNDGAEWRTRFNFKHIDTRNYVKFTVNAIFLKDDDNDDIAAG